MLLNKSVDGYSKLYVPKHDSLKILWKNLCMVVEYYIIKDF